MARPPGYISQKVKPPHPKMRGGGGERTVGFGSSEFRVVEIEPAIANFIIRFFHYSKKVQLASFIHLGVFIEREFVGVLQFGRFGQIPLKHKWVDAENQETLELARMWLSDAAPRNSESRAISYAIKFFKKVYPEIKIIQSFADGRLGKKGVVYQAANFQYYGYIWATFYELDGEMYHQKAFTVVKNNSFKKIGHRMKEATKHKSKQYRYLFFLDNKLMKTIKKKRLPYPKEGQEE
jgi:adenine modification enzyme